MAEPRASAESTPTRARADAPASDERLPGSTRDSMHPGLDPVAPQGSIAQRIKGYRLLWMLAIGVFVVDQLTKLWAARIPFNPEHIHGGGRDIVVIDGFFYLIHVGNTGAAWSMFSGQSTLLALLAAGTLLAIFFWRRSLGLRDRLTQICFGLLCGGIVGNLVDRLVHDHVIDFIDLHFGSYVYPTFNIADSGICIGVLLYLYQSLRAPSGGAAEPTVNK